MTPEGAPAGVEIKFLPRPPATGPYAVNWKAWFASHPAPVTVTEARPMITPRLILVHTNGAGGEGNSDSAFAWSMRDPNFTKPHYQVDMDGSATKFLPSNRKGIGNGTVASETHGIYASDFSLVIETADPGYGPGKPGQAAGFSLPQGETLAAIIAYEAELWQIPIEYPARWDGAGVACHTDPFGYPYWTIDKGHVCPGREKKIEMIEWIMPRARELMAHTPPPSGEEEAMQQIRVDGDPAVLLRDGLVCTWITDPAVQAALVDAKIVPATVELVDRHVYAALELHGPVPTGSPTTAADFARWVQ